MVRGREQKRKGQALAVNRIRVVRERRGNDKKAETAVVIFCEKTTMKGVKKEETSLG